jgi:hypothetical protein
VQLLQRALTPILDASQLRLDAWRELGCAIADAGRDAA